MKKKNNKAFDVFAKDGELITEVESNWVTKKTMERLEKAGDAFEFKAKGAPLPMISFFHPDLANFRVVGGEGSVVTEGDRLDRLQKLYSDKGRKVVVSVMHKSNTEDAVVTMPFFSFLWLLEKVTSNNPR